jgi:hypothetical protein
VSHRIFVSQLPRQFLTVVSRGATKDVWCLTQPHSAGPNKEDILSLLELGTPLFHKVVEVTPRAGEIKRSRPIGTNTHGEGYIDAKCTKRVNVGGWSNAPS